MDSIPTISGVPPYKECDGRLTTTVERDVLGDDLIRVYAKWEGGDKAIVTDLCFPKPHRLGISRFGQWLQVCQFTMKILGHYPDTQEYVVLRTYPPMDEKLKRGADE